MRTKHYFAYRQFQNGQPIDIEIGVYGSSRQEAREIAESIRAVRIPDFRFIGAN